MKQTNCKNCNGSKSTKKPSAVKRGASDCSNCGK